MGTTPRLGKFHVTLSLVLIGSLWAHTCPPDDPLLTDVEQLTQPNALYEVTRNAIASYPCDEELTPPILSDTLTLVVTALTGGTTFENEVHDCQRLVNEGGLEFGSLMGIFPLDGAMGAIPNGPIVAATIYSWGVDDGSDHPGYAPLGIPDDFEWGCLWIDKPNDRAAIIAVRTTLESGCVVGSSPPPDDDEWTLELEVHVGGNPPPTARWRWDNNLQEHYLGVKCGDDWCSIYSDPTTNRQVSRTFEGGPVHAGNYDEQRLAVDDGNGNLVPGPLAWLAPAPTLADTDSATLAGGDFVFVGQIELDTTTATPADVEVYRNKFNLAPSGTDPDIFQAEVWLTTKDIATGNDSDGAQVTNGIDPPKSLSVGFQLNAKHAAMGATRWRWMPGDEGMWYSCDRGCCTVFEDEGF